MAGSASRCIRTVVLCLLFGTQTLAAQDTTANGRTQIPRDTAHADRHTLFTTRDAALAAGFVGLTFAMFPVDRHFAELIQKEDIQGNKGIDQFARNVERIAAPGAFIIGGSMYLLGRSSSHRDIADLGWHGVEAVLLATSITTVLKGTLGRARPYATSDTNSRDFKLWGGFGNDQRQSFPSGHSTTAFAVAAAVTSEVRRTMPQRLWMIAPVMYGGASLVGVSRMYHNNHWASDVVLGAAIGTFSGLKVVRYSHAHPDNRLDRMILGASIVPDAHGGGTLAFNIPVP
ncbi:MAG: phosphoesterase PA-phosphatase related protein [Gemmatimonadetes bacterium]|nr:phosphoesterase PA-phosphatase related protein [Gemmatimonadota bacterium]